MTDDVRDSGPNEADEQPVATPPVWPQPSPGSAPPQTAWPPPAAAQAAPPAVTPAAWAPPSAPAVVPAPAPAVVPAAQAPTYPPSGYPASTYPPAGAQPATPKAKQAAPWAVGVPAPRRPVLTPPAGAAPPGAAPPPPVPPSVAPASSGGGRIALIAVGLVLLLGLAGGGTWFFLREDAPTKTEDSAAFGAPPADAGADDSADASDTIGGDSASEAPSSAPVPPPTAPATPTVTPEQQALTQLQALRAASLARLVTDERWVAQVASKSVGITDPLQTAANGTHTFYAVDILAESRAVTQSVPAQSVLVLQSTDFGKRSFAKDGQPYWITVVDQGFGSSDQVKAWCAATFSSLTPDQLANACAPRTLSPPHD